MSIIITLILLGLIVFIHEFGHFITAKLFHMPVLEFAIGIGPKLISRKVNTTRYSIRVIPFGGFVSIDGMEVEDGKKVENGFNTQSPFKRLVVLSAGVAMNFISSIIAIFLLFSVTNMVPDNYIKPQVKAVMAESALKGKLQSGDEILSINGNKIKSWAGLKKELGVLNKNGYNGEDIQISVSRDSKEMQITGKLTLHSETGGYILGVEPVIPKIGFFGKVAASFEYFWNMLVEIIKSLVSLLTGKVGMDQLTGPVGLTKVVGEAYIASGFIVLIPLFVLLSINIGLMNLLPFPALDGGRIIFVLLELIGIKVNKKIEEKFHLIGFAILLGFMMLIVFNDFRKL